MPFSDVRHLPWAGSQLPLAMPRSDARQNLIDSMTCATAFFMPPHIQLQEVAVCFGGRLMRGNRAQKACRSVAGTSQLRVYSNSAFAWPGLLPSMLANVHKLREYRNTEDTCKLWRCKGRGEETG